MRRIVRPVRLKNLMPVKRPNGSVDWYFRRKGQPLIRLPDLPHNDPQFLAEYAMAAKSTPVKPSASPGSIKALSDAALAANRYMSFSKAYSC